VVDDHDQKESNEENEATVDWMFFRKPSTTRVLPSCENANVVTLEMR
jgi:hypothetical protein